jgi:hypothetical protein
MRSIAMHHQHTMSPEEAGVVRRRRRANPAAVIAAYTTPNADGSWNGPKAVAHQFGVSHTTVVRYLHAAAIPLRPYEKRLTTAQRAEIVRLYTTPLSNGGWHSTKAICRQFGVTLPLVLYYVRRDGFTVRASLETRSGRACKPTKNLPAGDAPACQCGCGQTVAWHRRRNRWHVYVTGHYRRLAPYKDETWLRHEYEVLGRPASAIATQCGVISGTIRKCLVKFGIRIRPQPEALALSGGARGARNPAWKGGVAKWEYAPEWKRIARRIRKRDGYTCQLCYTVLPKSSRLLHVHHIDEDKFHNADTNLVTVCASCHPRGTRRSQEVAALLAARL